jgi:hypothetical protein
MRCLVLVLGLLLAGGAPAEPGLSAGDLTEIRAVINRQLEAFRRDDALGACVVYRPTSIEFLELLTMGHDAVQQVRFVDRGGRTWLAYYAMQRQRDGSWRTNGCRLVQPARTIPT